MVGHTLRINDSSGLQLFAQIAVGEEIERELENSTNEGKKRHQNQDKWDEGLFLKLKKFFLLLFLLFLKLD